MIENCPIIVVLAETDKIIGLDQISKFDGSCFKDIEK
jgi:hypothetical protein